MISLLTSLLLATMPVRPRAVPPSQVVGAVAPQRLHCRVTAAGRSRRCTVTIPAGRAVRACAPADAKAGHCGRAGTRKQVAWTVASNGAKCGIAKKRTDWSRQVVMTMKKKSATGGATCDLYVELA